MSQNTIDVLSRRHTHAIPPPPDENGEKRVVNIAAVVVVASVVGSVIMSRHVERRVFFSRAALILIAAELLILAFLRRRRVLQTLKTLFTAAAHPLNLAIYPPATREHALLSYRMAIVESAAVIVLCKNLHRARTCLNNPPLDGFAVLRFS